MFTGIVEELGTVAAVERSAGAAVLTVACSTVVAGARVGDSISVNGCCLTITRLESTPGFRCDLMGETLSRTALGALAPGAPVNLEPAVRIGSRLGGHLVQGHVDGIGEVLAVEAREQWTNMSVSLPAALAPYVVEKGSITIDGTSLTVTATEQDAFSVGLIPHTLAVTVLGQRRVGDAVNLEVDIIAKYVERLLRGGGASVYRAEE